MIEFMFRIMQTEQLHIQLSKRCVRIYAHTCTDPKWCEHEMWSWHVRKCAVTINAHRLELKKLLCFQKWGPIPVSINGTGISLLFKTVRDGEAHQINECSGKILYNGISIATRLQGQMCMQNKCMQQNQHRMHCMHKDANIPCIYMQPIRSFNTRTRQMRCTI